MLDLLSTPQDINDRYVSGRGLKRLALSRAGRIQLAADLASGRKQLHPSLAQAAALAGVAVADVREALKFRQECAGSPTPTPDAGDDLAKAWMIASKAEREAAIRAIGVANVWDALAAVVA